MTIWCYDHSGQSTEYSLKSMLLYNRLLNDLGLDQCKLYIKAIKIHSQKCVQNKTKISLIV